MVSKDKNSVIVELYDLTLTERKDDRFGRVVTTKTLTLDDLVSIAVAQRTDLNANTLRASMQILTEIAIKEIANGASVKFGLGYFNLHVNGVFIGDNAKWDSSLHNLAVNAVPVAELREAVNASVVDVRGMAATGTVINSVTDATSGAVNSKLTPGGGAIVTGSRIKIEGEAAGVGISLINQQTGEAISIPRTSLLSNDPSKVTFIIPATMISGDYKLNIGTQYSSSGIKLKETRICSFDYVLNVSA